MPCIILGEIAFAKCTIACILVLGSYKELGLIWFLGLGVLQCRGNRLLTGSNTRWLRLWEVDALEGVTPRGKNRNVEDGCVCVCVYYALQILLIIPVI